MKDVIVIGGVAMILATAGLGAAPAAAGPGDEARTLRVSYADLNLRSDAGARTMMTRIKSASYRVCGVHRGHVSVNAWLEQDCRKKAVSKAVADLDAPLVTALLSGPRAPVQVAAR